MKKRILIFLSGLVIGLSFIITGQITLDATSADSYCASCHVHPHSTISWKRSTHYDNKSGVRVHCVECHLPPKGEGYYSNKVRTGINDLYGHLFKDTSEFNWDAKSKLEQAKHHVFQTSCTHCHQSIFPLTLSKKGEEAHLYYDHNFEKSDIQCINCHLNAGHYDPNYSHSANKNFASDIDKKKEIYTEPTNIEQFENFTEQIPGSSVSFNMIAIPEGTFLMGSPANEKYTNENETPVKEVKVNGFFMGEIEVSWDEYLAFYSQTSGEGRTTDIDEKSDSPTDAITGATPPYGQPDQNWGMEQRPVISISFYAVETYCKWLSKVTGKKYRLPTEAEWEYACRAGTKGPYFFDGDVDKYMETGLFSSKRDTTIINSYAIYNENSMWKTALPSSVLTNPFGLKNMLGNVAEFCSDWYADDTYKKYPKGIIVNPSGPKTGTEHVVRGGSFRSDASQIRCAVRSHSRTTDWLKTDPQIPKSIWWYSDCFHVGFRLVCEYEVEQL